MKATIHGNCLMLEGSMDEDTNFQAIEAAFQELSSKGQKISIDFSKVTRANSNGIVGWLRFQKAAGKPFIYVAAPVWLVGQFNMISGYFANGSTVESLEVPFYCEENDETISKVFVIGKDIPLQKSYQGLDFPEVIHNGQTYVMDVDPQKYFRFLATNCELLSQSAG